MSGRQMIATGAVSREAVAHLWRTADAAALIRKRVALVGDKEALRLLDEATGLIEQAASHVNEFTPAPTVAPSPALAELPESEPAKPKPNPAGTGKRSRKKTSKTKEK